MALPPRMSCPVPRRSAASCASSREDTACALLNYGTISGSFFLDASGAVVNMGEFAVNSAQVLETDFYNLGTLIERGEVEEYVENGVVKFRRTGKASGGSSPLAGGFGLLGR